MRGRLRPEARERWVQPRPVLRWVYLCRIALASGVFAAAALSWSVAPPLETFLASLALVLTLIVTPISYWYSHVRRGGEASSSFIYAQAVYDVLLLTAVVDLTGGSGSILAPTYILLISAYAVLLPLRGSFLVAGLSCIGYIADTVWGQRTPVDTGLALQVAIFVAVALVVGLIGTKLRQEREERSAVEHELEQLKLDTSDILGNLSTAVLTIDGEGRLAYANPAAEALLGIPLGARLQRPFLDELRKIAPGLHRILERARVYGVSVASAEITIARARGPASGTEEGEEEDAPAGLPREGAEEANGRRAVPVGVSTAVLVRRSGPPSVTAIMRDISDRKRIQELRTRAERLQAVAEMSASLAHEIKNPLAAIRSSIQQLDLPQRLERSDGEDDDRTLARLVLRESDRLSRLLSEFIDFARVRIARSESFDLREVVGEAIEAVRQHPDCRAGIEIEEHVDPDPVSIEGDRDLMHRVVTNLVLNSLQAAEPSRTMRVTVEVRNGTVERTPRGIGVPGPILLSVSDDGPGIPEGDLERIFDPFFSGRPGGTGLGLAIVHRAVEAHHGTIFVESGPRTGTRFSIHLPAAPPQRVETPAGGGE